MEDPTAPARHVLDIPWVRLRSASSGSQLFRRMISEVDRKAKNGDIVVALVHAGTEYTTEPTSIQEEFARGLVDAGADLVIGHHPHWPQLVEEYQGKWIFYSLGNFVFDQEWSEETKEGLVLQATWQDGALSELRLVPIIIENYSTPRLANSAESERILQRIGRTDSVIFSR